MFIYTYIWQYKNFEKYFIINMRLCRLRFEEKFGQYIKKGRKRETFDSLTQPYVVRTTVPQCHLALCFLSTLSTSIYLVYNIGGKTLVHMYQCFAANSVWFICTGYNVYKKTNCYTYTEMKLRLQQISMINDTMAIAECGYKTNQMMAYLNTQSSLWYLQYIWGGQVLYD